MSLKRKSKQTTSLSEKISNSLTVAPRADIEDDLVFDAKPKTVTKEGLEEDRSTENVSISDFRKRNVKLLAEHDDKYAGEIGGRHDDNFETKSSEDEFGDTSSSVSFHSEDDNDEANSDDDNDDEDNEDDEEMEESDDNNYDISQFETNDDGEFRHMVEQSKSEEIKKGDAVKNQLKMWEGLLEIRINMQKCLMLANRMPTVDTFETLKVEKNGNFSQAVNKTKNSIHTLIDKFLDMQETLLNQYPESKNVLKDDNNASAEDSDDEEILSDCDSLTDKNDVPVNQTNNRKRKHDLSEELETVHEKYRKYRNSVIQKWHDKTRLSVGNKKNQTPMTTLSQIDFILNDKSRLIRKTQMKRSNYGIIGLEQKSDDENLENVDNYCSEIFDDDDFYHQLLRELIEHKSADVSDPIQLSRQWIALQQMRSKIKRKIDTKATKGRRIRYTVHNKLVNFMAPVKSCEWTDSSKNELFASLFGKQFENVS